MADGFQRLVAGFHKHFPEVQLKAEGRVEWGATHSTSRLEIRRALTQALQEEGLQDLTQPPRSPQWSISISHCKSFGAWLAVKRPQQVGFDCEEISRVRPAIAGRVSTPAEMAEAPSPAALWAAKEAVYKALEIKQPATVGEIVITGWSAHSTDQYFFSSSSHQGCQGYLYIENDLLFTVALVSS